MTKMAIKRDGLKRMHWILIHGNSKRNREPSITASYQLATWTYRLIIAYWENRNGT